MICICTACRKKKPEKAFRLIKDTWCSKPRVCRVCMEWEQVRAVKICLKCNRIVMPEEVFITTPKLTVCKVCHQVELIYRQIAIKKAELQLKKTIKLLTTMANTIDGLRGQLMSTIEGLKDGSITPEVAHSIDAIAKTIIESAKAETEFVRIAGGTGSGFIPVLETAKQLQE